MDNMQKIMEIYSVVNTVDRMYIVFIMSYSNVATMDLNKSIKAITTYFAIYIMIDSSCLFN
jgi:hypothetical protein